MLRFRAALGAALTLAIVSIGCHDIDIDFESRTENIKIFDDLYSVSTADGRHVVSVGYYGAVYWSDDAGDSWKRGSTDTRLSLYNVAMADAKNGWAVGQRGLILRTEDGGATWTEQPNLKQTEGTHLFSVAAVDANTAWVIGEWGTRIFTKDGGKTWVDDSFTIDEMHPLFVWLSPTEQEKVRRGEKVYDDVSLNDITCLTPPSRHCWLIGEFGYLFRSEDRGETWEKASIEGSIELAPIPLGYNVLESSEEDRESLRPFAEAVKDQGHLNVAVEAMASAREIAEFGSEDDPFEFFEILEARSQNVRGALEEFGVPTDRLRLRGQPPWDYEDYLEDDPNFLKRYMKGRLAETPAVKVSVIQNPILFTVHFRDEENGLIGGLGGVILRSDDGGKTWAYRTIERKQAFFSVASVEGRALAIGEKGLVRVSVDDGNVWREPDDNSFPSVYTFMRDLAFGPDGRVGFIVGQGGRILRSTDAGYEWEQVLPPPGSEI
ncbi:MAG: hypothetical protein JRG96_03495 [Deltaproteobacteria bacterium]|nr:hypothetical protein [Deltaproteobacteria bacterium]MBW2417385.1 hypothetical protein [Deltaproteobacteria bacterium]